MEIEQMEMLQEVLGEQECMGFKCRGVYIRRLLEMTTLFLKKFDAEILISCIRCDMFGIGLVWIGLVWVGRTKVGGYGMTIFDEVMSFLFIFLFF